jgi:hypothetical protein
MSIKSAIARLFRAQVRLALEELQAEPRRGALPHDYERIAWKLAAEDSARYLLNHMQAAENFVTAHRLREHALTLCAVDGLILEFGVFSGASIKQIAATTKQEVHGFDSWEGLPEDWTHWQKSGRFSTEGRLPDMTGFDNVRLHKGWFENTLPVFLESHPGPIRFLHIDCDLYSSTKTILDLCRERIVSGTVIVFDEYLNYPGWQQHEIKAWKEAGVSYRYAGFASGEYAVSVVCV